MAQQFMLRAFFAGKVDGERAEHNGAGDQAVLSGMAQTKMLGGNAGVGFPFLYCGKDVGMTGKLDDGAMNL